MPGDKSKDKKLPPGKAAEMLVDAESKGNLKPLEDVLAASGVGQSASDIMAAAAKNEFTKGKTVEELATMLEDDPDLMDQLVQEVEGPEDKESNMPNKGKTFSEAMGGAKEKALKDDWSMDY